MADDIFGGMLQWLHPEPEQAGVESDEAVEVPREDIDAGKDGHHIPEEELTPQPCRFSLRCSCAETHDKLCVGSAWPHRRRLFPGFGSVNYRSAFAQADRTRTG